MLLLVRELDFFVALLLHARSVPGTCKPSLAGTAVAVASAEHTGATLFLWPSSTLLLELQIAERQMFEIISRILPRSHIMQVANKA